MGILLFCVVFFCVVLMIILFCFIYGCRYRESFSDKIQWNTGKEDKLLNGVIQPFLIPGNPFYNFVSGVWKASFSSFYDLYLSTAKSLPPMQNILMKDYVSKFRVLGIGDARGGGWNGSDGDGSFLLPNNDVIMCFGDTFYSSVVSRNLFEAHRSAEDLQMFSNSICYFRRNKTDASLETAIYYIGNKTVSQANLQFNPSECGATRQTMEQLWIGNQEDPLNFMPRGCGDLITVDPKKTFVWSKMQEKALAGLKHARTWLLGGASDTLGNIYLYGETVAKDIIPEPGIVENVFIRIQNAFDDKEMKMNPFLWDGVADKKHFPPSLARYQPTKTGYFKTSVRWGSVFPIQEKHEYGLLGIFNDQVHIIRFLIHDFFESGIYLSLQKDGKWKRGQEDIETMNSLKIHNLPSKFHLGIGAMSEIYQYQSLFIFLVLVPGEENHSTSVHRVIAQRLEGPYRFQDEPCYRIPVDATNNAIYALHVHSALTMDIKDPVEIVFSYIYQPSYPIHSDRLFDSDSCFRTYFPQIVILYA